MPSKAKQLERDVAKLPSIPKELVAQFLTGPMTGEAINAAGLAFKQALIEASLNAELSHHLGYLPGAEKPEAVSNHRNGGTSKTVLTGAGGIAGHVRFGARTATAPVLIGLVFLVLGVCFGASGYALLRTVPDAVLGSLLMFSGIELALSSKPRDYHDAELFLVLLMAAIGVALNPAAAFVVGLPIAYGLRQGRLKV